MPGLCIKSENETAELPDGWLTYTVSEPASLGLEFWLSALARGFTRVAIMASQLPASTHQALEKQAELGRAILTGLGYPPVLAVFDDITELDVLPIKRSQSLKSLQASDDKRMLLFQSLDSLIEGVEHPPVSVSLPSGLLGEIRVSAEKCTLCTTCVRVCPSEALSLPGTTLQLAFTEQLCVQCGLCQNACPEKAITLIPRLVISRNARTTRRVVAEAQAFSCAECGKQFATVAMVERSRAMMAGHPMFQGANARLMEMCPDCRQRAMAGVQS